MRSREIAPKPFAPTIGAGESSQTKSASNPIPRRPRCAIASTPGRLRAPSVRKRLRSRSPTSSDQPHWPLSLATRGGAKSSREHDDITHACVEVAGGQVVKHLGDGFLLTFASASSALNALDQLRRGLAESKFQPPLTVRAGLHAGEPISDDEDLFGLQVNIAARISALAEPDEILVSSVIRDLSVPGRTEFSAPRSVALKGIPGEITVCTAKPIVARIL